MERTETRGQAKSKQQLVQELALLREKEKALEEAAKPETEEAEKSETEEDS